MGSHFRDVTKGDWDNIYRKCIPKEDKTCNNYRLFALDIFMHDN